MTQEAIFEKHSLSPTIKKYKNTNAPGMMLTSFFNPTSKFFFQTWKYSNSACVNEYESKHRELNILTQ